MRTTLIPLCCLAAVDPCSAQTPSWKQIRPTTSPSVRAGHEMVFDTNFQRTLLFGGVAQGYGARLADTWHWDGKDWVLLKPTTSPPARYSHAMAYDSARRRAVMFGGTINHVTGFRDTWEWDGLNWSQRKPTKSPSARFNSAMAYDAARRRTVLYGGVYFNNGRPVVLGDTWEWNGSNWTEIKPTSSPPPGHAGGMVFDSTRQRIVLFGGDLIGDTWEWDGRNWMKRSPSTSPRPRGKPAMVYDSARQRTVLFSGHVFTAGSAIAETWERTGTNWVQIKASSSPSARSFAGQAYDPVRQRTVLFGGQLPKSGSVYTGDTWEYGTAKPTLTANTPTISIAKGGTQVLSIDVEAGLGSKPYWIFGSMTGTRPGIVLSGTLVPLRPDAYTDMLIGTANSSVFAKFKGGLTASGTATASLNVTANLPIPKGFRLHHACVVYDNITNQLFTASNPVSVEFR